MKKKPIDKLSLGYLSLTTYDMLVHRIFYRKTQVLHRKRIPGGRPVLMAPNHQNAVMDAMAPLMTSRRYVVFLARGDIFRKKRIARILRFFKILPVFRIRDGVGELSKNEEIFNEAVEVLKRKRSPVVIMPEGNHGDRRRLRPLVKGIFRIAFSIQEEYGTDPGVVIVPVGLDYSKYEAFRGKLLVQYGEPIEVCEYYVDYLENQPKAINRIRERLSEEMRKYMIDIRSEEYYSMNMQLRKTYNKRMRERLGFIKKDLHHRFLADQHMIQQLETAETEHSGKIAKLAELCREYEEGITSLRLRDWVLSKVRYSVPALLLASIGMLTLLPLFLYGTLTNLFPYLFTSKITRRLKDIQFHSTGKFVIGQILFPIYYLLIFILVWIFAEPAWIKWVFLGSLPLTGLFAHVYLIWYKKMKGLWRYQGMTMTKNKKLARLKNLRDSILVQTEELISV